MIRQVPEEDNIETLSGKLSNSKWAAEDAYIEVNAANQHMLDASLAHEIIRLGAFGDGVTISNFDGRMLARPGIGITLFPSRLTVTAAVGIVDGQRQLFPLVEVAPS